MSRLLASARAAPPVPEALRALVDALPMPAMVLAPDGELLHANTAARAEPPEGRGTPLDVPGIGECRLVVSPPPPDPQTQRLASLGFMLAGVCHDVSNPLAAVSSMAQILQSKRGVSAETMTKGLASISSNIARVLAITKKLGDFSRVTGEAPADVCRVPPVEKTIEPDRDLADAYAARRSKFRSLISAGD